MLQGGVDVILAHALGFWPLIGGATFLVLADDPLGTLWAGIVLLVATIVLRHQFLARVYTASDRRDLSRS